MSRVRFVVLLGPASLDPKRMGWQPRQLSEESQSAELARVGSLVRDDEDTARRGRSIATRSVDCQGAWFVWRLIGRNNRELGRSVSSFGSYSPCRQAVEDLRLGAAKLVPHTVTDLLTGRWGWRVAVDGDLVAAYGRWYGHERNCRAGMMKFVDAVRDADVVPGVITLRDRSGPVVRGRAVGAAPW